MAGTVWLTHPDVPASLTEQPADSSLVVMLKARGWEETTEPTVDDPAVPSDVETVDTDPADTAEPEASPAARPGRRHTTAAHKES